MCTLKNFPLLIVYEFQSNKMPIQYLYCRTLEVFADKSACYHIHIYIGLNKLHIVREYYTEHVRRFVTRLKLYLNWGNNVV